MGSSQWGAASGASLCSRAYPSYSIVLMMKPSVGLTVLTSSPIIFLTIVVFPALSRPLDRQQGAGPSSGTDTAHSISIRSSLSFSRAFRSIDNISRDSRYASKILSALWQNYGVHEPS